MLGEIESSLYRNKTQKDIEISLKPLFDKCMPMNSNSAGKAYNLDAERKKDHYSHFILRLAFCRSYVSCSWNFRETNCCREDLRRRFVRAETMLFRIRYGQDDARERQQFIETLNLDWETVSQSCESRLIECRLMILKN